MSKRVDSWAVVELQLGRTRPVPEPDGLKRMIRRCRGTAFEPTRNRAIIRLLFYTGLYATDLARLKIDDVDLEQNPPLLAVRKPRRRAFFVPFWGKAAADLTDYLRLRVTGQGGNRALFWGRTRSLTAAEISKIVQHTGQEAGLDGLDTRAIRRYSRLLIDERVQKAHSHFSPIARRRKKKPAPGLD